MEMVMKKFRVAYEFTPAVAVVPAPTAEVALRKVHDEWSPGEILDNTVDGCRWRALQAWEDGTVRPELPEKAPAGSFEERLAAFDRAMEVSGRHPAGVAPNVTLTRIAGVWELKVNGEDLESGDAQSPAEAVDLVCHDIVREIEAEGEAARIKVDNVNKTLAALRQVLP